MEKKSEESTDTENQTNKTEENSSDNYGCGIKFHRRKPPHGTKCHAKKSKIHKKQRSKSRTDGVLSPPYEGRRAPDRKAGGVALISCVSAAPLLCFPPIRPISAIDLHAARPLGVLPQEGGLLGREVPALSVCAEMWKRKSHTYHFPRYVLLNRGYFFKGLSS